MPNYVKLPPFDDDGNLNMVVETPRGSAVKLKYEPKTFHGLSLACAWADVPVRLGLYSGHKGGGWGST